jgi:hypothetical protein
MQARSGAELCRVILTVSGTGRDTASMDGTGIAEAYSTFAVTLRAGGFARPDTGWDAPLIAAHIAANNDLIASTAEDIAAGQRPSYDNAQVIDDERLRQIASAAGSLDAMAELIETSAARLGRAWELLGPELGSVEVPAKIADGGHVVRDGPIPIRSFIEGNATFHLQLHLDQLRSLQVPDPA